MTILQFCLHVNCLPKNSKRRLYASAYQIGLNWILVGSPRSTHHSPFHSLWTLEISIYFYMHVCMLFLLISSVWLNWKSTLSLHAHQERQRVQCEPYFFSSCYHLFLLLIFCDGCFHSNLSFSTSYNGYCCIVTFDSWIHYYAEIRLHAMAGEDENSVAYLNVVQCNRMLKVWKLLFTSSTVMVMSLFDATMLQCVTPLWHKVHLNSQHRYFWLSAWSCKFTNDVSSPVLFSIFFELISNNSATKKTKNYFGLHCGALWTNIFSFLGIRTTLDLSNRMNAFMYVALNDI